MNAPFKPEAAKPASRDYLAEGRAKAWAAYCADLHADGPDDGPVAIEKVAREHREWMDRYEPRGGVR